MPSDPQARTPAEAASLERAALRLLTGQPPDAPAHTCIFTPAGPCPGCAHDAQEV